MRIRPVLWFLVVSRWRKAGSHSSLVPIHCPWRDGRFAWPRRESRTKNLKLDASDGWRLLRLRYHTPKNTWTIHESNARFHSVPALTPHGFLLLVAPYKLAEVSRTLTSCLWLKTLHLSKKCLIPKLYFRFLEGIPSECNVGSLIYSRKYSVIFGP